MRTLFLFVCLALAARSFAQECNLDFMSGSCSPNPCQISSALTVQLQVQNTGELACTDVEFRFYLSLDTLLDEEDLLLGTSLATVAPAETATLTRTISPLSSATGVTNRDYNIIAENSGSGEEHVYTNCLTVWPLSNTYHISSGYGVFGNLHEHVDTYFYDYWSQSGLGYYLFDYTRRPSNNIHGHDGNMIGKVSTGYARDRINGSQVSGLRGRDANNVWNDSLSQSAAIDAHVYAGLVYDYLWHHLGRNSYDNNMALVMPTELYSTILYGSTQRTCNAANIWFTSWGSLSYAVTDYYRPGNVPDCHWMSGCIDIVAHEWAHGVTVFESFLTYSGESGALSESFSDMMGCSVGFWTDVDPDWLCGEVCSPSGGRDLQNPPSRVSSTSGLPYPDTYQGPGWYIGTADYGGVHTNSSVANKMFYLLSDGGTHNGISVDGIGIENAMMLVYRANRDYWVSSTDFANGREGCIAAAQDLNPSYVPSVMNAWAAVGVGQPAPRPDAITDLAIHTTLDPQGINLNWSPAPGNVSYKIHASGRPGFVPDANTLIGTTAGTSFSEPLSVSDGMRFYKVVVVSVP